MSRALAFATSSTLVATDPLPSPFFVSADVAKSPRLLCGDCVLHSFGSGVTCALSFHEPQLGLDYLAGDIL